MNRMNKFFAGLGLTVAGITAVGLTACGGTTTHTPAASPAPVQSTAPAPVGYSVLLSPGAIVTVNYQFINSYGVTMDNVNVVAGGDSANGVTGNINAGTPAVAIGAGDVQLEGSAHLYVRLGSSQQP
jgi:hypothetical protein